VRFFDLTLPTPQENLALDEALLDEAEASAEPLETLRLWESPEPFVVVGRGSQVSQEVNVQYCQRRSIKILRRTSGGAAVVAGPGSLMYAVVLSYTVRPELRSLDAAHQFVLSTTLRGIQRLIPGAERRGTSDLAVGSLKFSGNSLRCKRTHFLYHGTLLYDFSLELIEQCLTLPPRQPEYRRGRSHEAFLLNLQVPAARLRECLLDTWGAGATSCDWPQTRVKQLVDSKYSRDEWNLHR
jgi:lipoate---protein ligase